MDREKGSLSRDRKIHQAERVVLFIEAWHPTLPSAAFGATVCSPIYGTYDLKITRFIFLFRIKENQSVSNDETIKILKSQSISYFLEKDL